MSAQSVLFLAPEILPGAGGVADYCGQLAAALTPLGFDCHLASWNETAAQIGDLGFPSVALHTAGATHLDKSRKLRRYLDDSAIEWVSLQFVNFGFAKRGLIGGLGKSLRGAIQDRPCHIFLHELWLGAHRGARLREKAWGYVQKLQTLRLIEHLEPRAVWTSIHYYRRLLAHEGVACEVLPIFGNIPISQERADAWILQQCKDAPEPRENYLLIGLFGTLHRAWPFQAVIPRIMAWAGQRRVVFVLFGRNGETAEFRGYIDSLSRAELLSLGSLQTEAIDRVMNSMDLALATTPAEGLGKSGSAVAFLERGVPTIAVKGDLEIDDVEGAEHPCLVLLDDHLEQRLDALRALPRPHRPILPPVAERYRELFATADRRNSAALPVPS